MTATIDEHTTFSDVNGKPIVNGSMFIGIRNLDPKLNLITIFSDRDLTVPLANPQTLDAFGQSVNKIWVPERYSILVEDSNDVQRYQELDNGELPLTGITQLSNVQGTNTITANATPAIDAYVNGQVYLFIPAVTNTSTTTLNIDNVGPRAIEFNNAVLGGGELIAGATFQVAFNEPDDVFDLLGSQAGASGGGGDKIFYENDITVTTDFTITTNKNAMSAGPITINATVTVPSGSVWTIV